MKRLYLFSALLNALMEESSAVAVGLFLARLFRLFLLLPSFFVGIIFASCWRDPTSAALSFSSATFDSICLFGGGGKYCCCKCVSKQLRFIWKEDLINLQETLQAKALARNNRASGHTSTRSHKDSLKKKGGLCHRYQLLWLANDSTDSADVADVVVVVVVAADMASPPPPPPLGDDGASDAESILGDWGSVLASAGAGGVIVGKGFLIPRLIAVQKTKKQQQTIRGHLTSARMLDRRQSKKRKRTGGIYVLAFHCLRTSA